MPQKNLLGIEKICLLLLQCFTIKIFCGSGNTFIQSFIYIFWAKLIHGRSVTFNVHIWLSNSLMVYVQGAWHFSVNGCFPWETAHKRQSCMKLSPMGKFPIKCTGLLDVLLYWFIAREFWELLYWFIAGEFWEVLWFISRDLVLSYH